MQRLIVRPARLPVIARAGMGGAAVLAFVREQVARRAVTRRAVP
jgi:hypothetical protein